MIYTERMEMNIDKFKISYRDACTNKASNFGHGRQLVIMQGPCFDKNSKRVAQNSPLNTAFFSRNIVKPMIIIQTGNQSITPEKNQ